MFQVGHNSTSMSYRQLIHIDPVLAPLQFAAVGHDGFDKALDKLSEKSSDE